MKNRKKNIKALNKATGTGAVSEDSGKDWDNDGKDEPDDEEYLQNKDKAIKKAMKDEGYTIDTAKDIEDVEAKRAKTARYKKKTASMHNETKKLGGVTGIPMLGDMIRKK